MASLIEQELTQLIEPLASARGLDIDSIDVVRASRRTKLRIAVDADGGVDLDTVSDLSREISDVLDQRDLLDSSYVLEVGTPGVDRPLTLPVHWRRAVGRLVEIVTTSGSKIKGRIVAVDGNSAVIDVEGRQETLDIYDVARAVVQVELNPPKGRA